MLYKVTQIILEGHSVHHCIKEAIDAGESDEAIKKFEKQQAYFANLK